MITKEDLYDSYISSYFMYNDMDLSPHELFLLELHRLGVDISLEQAKIKAANIALELTHNYLEQGHVDAMSYIWNPKRVAETY